MKRVLPIAVLLFALANAILCLRVFAGDVSLARMKPRIDYLLSLTLEMGLQGDDASARVYLPGSNEFQTIRTERVESAHLSYDLVREGGNRRGVWEARGLSGQEATTYNATVTVRPVRFELPEGAPIPEQYPDEVLPYLESTDVIQSDAPEIRELASQLREGVPGNDLSLTIRALYDFVHDEVENSDYENTLDALTTLKWREAFCGGKSRLLVALLRASNIPAKMIGGIILSPGSKRTTHAWLSVWVNGVWVPMDALNGHFAEHPANYLVLYEGDHALISRSKDISFNYLFHIEKWRVPPDEVMAAGTSTKWNSYIFWDVFRKAHISLNLLRILLLLPLGALIVILLRNVVGLTTFGTFQPALLAVAFRESGILWGIALYLGILVIGAVLRRAVDWLQLLHTPRIAVILTFIVAFMLGTSYLAVRAGMLAPASVSMFPIALLAITVESAFIRGQERGTMETIKVLLGTLFAVGLIYLVFDSFVVQAVIFVFPEILLAILGLYLLLGRFVGMRLFEYHRFRWLLAK